MLQKPATKRHLEETAESLEVHAPHKPTANLQLLDPSEKTHTSTKTPQQLPTKIPIYITTNEIKKLKSLEVKMHKNTAILLTASLLNQTFPKTDKDSKQVVTSM